jgi:hypothetical protein
LEGSTEESAEKLAEGCLGESADGPRLRPRRGIKMLMTQGRSTVGRWHFGTKGISWDVVKPSFLSLYSDIPVMHALASIGAGIAPGHLHLSISLLACSHPGWNFTVICCIRFRRSSRISLRTNHCESDQDESSGKAISYARKPSNPD